MPYKALLANPDTRTAGTICPDIYLAALGAADILLIFFDSFAGPTSTSEIFCKR